ncbi:MAG TPA: isoaspartyl peptidase/L-asparaginase [Polyangiaceae bacterium]|nr:isoaspartyl peptidase/L-asparaginase [Polyangiaceae bacterium]
MSDPSLGDLRMSWGARAGAWGILVHGGAGSVPAEHVQQHVQGCRSAAFVAATILRAGGSALDAVESAVVALEDDPCFNAGTGACLNSEGRIELDAALMEGRDLRAGAVCALPPFLHPIAVARAVLDDGRHVLYAADGAARFAREHGFEPSTSEAMTTVAARARWAAAASEVDRTSELGGTVGAVARDLRGNVAAATSTGGRLGKRPGRVGDSPLLGAGTYADNDAGACSATGLGESIMRICLAKSATDLMRCAVDPEEAARAVIRRLDRRGQGTGGAILVDRDGRFGLARNTPEMTWAAVGAELAEAFGV